MALVVHYESDFVELTDFEIHAPTVRLLPRAWCRRLGLVVLNRVEAADRAPAVVAMVAPEDQTTAEEVARLLGRPIHVRRLTRYEVDHALNLGWDGPESLGNEGNGRVLRAPGPLLRPESSAVDLVDRLLIDAIHSSASDIHLETYAHDVDLRLRIDGRMEQVFTHITPDNVAEVVARLKVLANLDIAERWKAQDGRFRVTLVQGAETRVVDLRINTAPSPAGQDVVLRILDATRGLLPLQALGLTPALLKEWRKLIHNPEGMLLVTGPTGSGKTTTLYASLAELVAEGRKIVTAEDPIEYVVDHVNQKQVSPQMGWAELLRAALRQNPDVLFFGELRDKDSAANATSAAATGHLVLSTLHTSDTVGVIPRLRGIGLEDMDIAEALLGVLAQRLFRRVCAACAEPRPPTATQVALFGPLLEGGAFRQGRGCAACKGTGYRGRVGVYELLVCDVGFGDLITEGASTNTLRAHARKQGQRLLAEEALDRARDGVTSLEEIERNIPYRQILAARAPR
jgi:general secretion pathway protein E